MLYNANANSIGIGFLAPKSGNKFSVKVYENLLNESSLIQIHFEDSSVKFLEYDNNKFSKYEIYGIEFSNEKIGLILDSLNGNLARVQIGKKGSVLILGWIKLDSTNLAIYTWDVFFMNKPIFFNNFQNDGKFFNNPYSKDLLEIKINKLSTKSFMEVVNELIVIEHDYIMYPLEIKGTWMKVNLVTPSDLCPQNNLKVENSFFTVWIRFLDDQLHTLVWYYPRGC